MKPSTGSELLGFALVSAAAWQFSHVLGLFVAGICFLFIGYATDDGAVAVSARKLIEPISRKRAARKAKRAQRKAG